MRLARLPQLAIHVMVAALGKGGPEGVAGGKLQRRLGEQVALHIARTALQGEVHLLFGFHALGDDPAAGLLGHLRQGFHYFAAGAAACCLLEQAHVQLEDVRLQRQHAIQLRVTGTEVVDGDTRTCVSIARHHFGQTLVGTAQLGDLEDHPFGRHALLLQLLEAGQWLVRA